MSWDLSKLGNCAIHGRHAGKECPLCGPQKVSIEEKPAAIEYDRSNWHRGPEKDLHDWFEADMIRLGVFYIHARTDQKSTIANGWPDFTLIRFDGEFARCCLVEFKNKAGRTSKDQDQQIAELRASGIPVLVTGDYAEALAFVKEHLSILNA